MRITWICFNINNQAEYWLKEECGVLWIAQTQRNGALYEHNQWDWAENSEEKRTNCYSRHYKRILLHYEARPHCRISWKHWEILPHLSRYIADIARSSCSSKIQIQLLKNPTLKKITSANGPNLNSQTTPLEYDLHNRVKQWNMTMRFDNSSLHAWSAMKKELQTFQKHTHEIAVKRQNNNVLKPIYKIQWHIKMTN